MAKKRKQQEPVEPVEQLDLENRIVHTQIIFSPHEDLQEMMAAAAAGLKRNGKPSRGRIIMTHEGCKITLKGKSLHGKTQDTVQTINELSAVKARFRDVPTDSVEILMYLHYQLEKCRCVIEAVSSYEKSQDPESDGGKDPEKELWIQDKVQTAAKAVHGLVAPDEERLVTPDGATLMTVQGETDLKVWTPDELPPTQAWLEEQSQEALSRRARTAEVFREKNIYLPAMLPLSHVKAEDPSRSKEEVCGRLAALFSLVRFAQCRMQNMNYEDCRETAERSLADCKAADALSPDERDFLNKKARDLKEIQRICWQEECLVVLLWALGLLEELPWPGGKKEEKTDPFVVLRSFENWEELVAAAELRPRGELLDQADLAWCLDWAATYLRDDSAPPPRGLDSNITLERNRAFTWLCGRPIDRWDFVNVLV